MILLTARREEEERVKGFEVGADDYITKPFSARELTLRVEALLRRSKAEPVSVSRRISVGPVELDREAHRAFSEGDEVELTPLDTTSGQPEARVDIHGVRVGAADLLGDPQGGAAIVEWIVERASAALAASIFHFEDYAIPEVKQYLKERGVVVR